MRVLWLAAAASCAALAACATATPGQTGATVTATASPVTSGRASGAPGPETACRSGQGRGAPAGSLPAGLTGVQFVSLRQGWAVGGDRILATSDGGAHWQVQDRGRLGLTSLDFINGSDGWAVGRGRVLVTTDGGAHWHALPEPCPLIDAVHFVSPSVGFAVAGGTVPGGPVVGGPPVPPRNGVLLATGDGGRAWHRVHAPADVQSACFTGPVRGWAGAHGRLYRTVDGGTTWALATAGVGGAGGQPYLMTVQCAGPDAAWALDLGTGAALSHAPVVGYHAGPEGAKAIFAEQYFPHPGVSVTAGAPGTYPGPLSAIGPGTAVVIGWCPPCGYGTAPWDLLTRSGAVITSRGNVGGLTEAAGASFLTPRLGWVVGADYLPGRSRPVQRQRIVKTTDGGHSWQNEYSYRP
ncbi:MAG: WD40/YVTN/BNR-like repeat-containing protein [Streptosporangiales bacterium]